jgi:hypothetical protein
MRASQDDRVAPVPAAARPVFTVQLRPEPQVTDPIRALRFALKFLLRRFGLRAISISDDTPRASP